MLFYFYHHFTFYSAHGGKKDLGKKGGKGKETAKEKEKRVS